MLPKAALNAIRLGVIAFFSLASTLPVQSQVVYGAEVPTSAVSKSKQLTRLADDRFAVARKNNKTFEVVLFKANMNFSDRLLLPPKLGKASMDFYAIVRLAGVDYILLEGFDPSLKHHVVYSKPISAQEGIWAPGSDWLKVAGFPIQKTSIDEIRHVLSPDGSKLLFYYDANLSCTYPQMLWMSVRGEGMQELWHHNYTLDHKCDLLKEEEYVVANDGEVYIFGVKYESSKDYGKGTITPNDYLSRLYRFTKDGQANMWPLDMGDKDVSELIMMMTGNDDLVLMGLSHNHRRKFSNGLVYAILSRDGQFVEGPSTLPFTEKFVYDMYGYWDKVNRTNSHRNRDMTVAEIGLSNLQPIMLAEANEGGYYFITEDQWVVEDPELTGNAVAYKGISGDAVVVYVTGGEEPIIAGEIVVRKHIDIYRQSDMKDVSFCYLGGHRQGLLFFNEGQLVFEEFLGPRSTRKGLGKMKSRDFRPFTNGSAVHYDGGTILLVENGHKVLYPAKIALP